MLDRYLMKRPRSRFWQLRVPVPSDVQKSFGRNVVTRSLKESDRMKAAERAMPILMGIRAEWDAIRLGISNSSTSTDMIDKHEPTEGEMLSIIAQMHNDAKDISKNIRAAAYAESEESYEDKLNQEESQQVLLAREIAMGNFNRWIEPADRILTKRGFALSHTNPSFLRFLKMFAEATVEAISHSNRMGRGELSPVPSSDSVREALAHKTSDIPLKARSPFSELVNNYMLQWDAGKSDQKITNTRQQKLSTFLLFQGFSSNLPIAKVSQEQAALFYDTLRLFQPKWARIPRHKHMSWTELVREFGNQQDGLSDSTMNRHMGALKTLWDWAHKRGYCQGENPFEGFRKRLRPGVNTIQYVPWEHNELATLFTPPPKRDDICEIMIVAMFTGMRLNEIASLTWNDLHSKETINGDEIHYFVVNEAKTPAGNRQVPVHSALSWLIKRKVATSNERIWPTFNKEGVGKKPGADAGNEFSVFKRSKGFKARRKAFHSFRKNVTRIMELASVPENEWAQIIGHERGFTYSTYNPDGISLDHKRNIIELINYPNVPIPHPLS